MRNGNNNDNDYYYDDKARSSSFEEGIGSKGRLRILKVMARQPESFFTRYQLQRLTRLNAIGVKADLSVLMKIGWVKEHRGEPRKYQIELENPVASEIAQFFRRVGYV